MREIKFVVCIEMLFIYSGREVKCVDNIKNEMEIRESRNTCRKMPAYGETSRDATILKAIEKDAVFFSLLYVHFYLEPLQLRLIPLPRYYTRCHNFCMSFLEHMPVCRQV